VVDVALRCLEGLWREPPKIFPPLLSKGAIRAQILHVKFSLQNAVKSWSTQNLKLSRLLVENQGKSDPTGPLRVASSF
jgi:hypothetical protein